MGIIPVSMLLNKTFCLCMFSRFLICSHMSKVKASGILSCFIAVSLGLVSNAFLKSLEVLSEKDGYCSFVAFTISLYPSSIQSEDGGLYF
uniref:Uncharacterized protein n=1 Tax=Pyxicephalus adspersus TaxID=30357 RepID=A0AAV2ZXI7_PYXAD|nr:TPA: hypothetical protein GDO54_015281 [Pyxicephalus adspersus]